MYSFLTFYYPAISDLLIIICKNSKKGFKSQENHLKKINSETFFAV